MYVCIYNMYIYIYSSMIYNVIDPIAKPPTLGMV